MWIIQEAEYDSFLGKYFILAAFIDEIAAREAFEAMQKLYEPEIMLVYHEKARVMYV